jgi:flagellin
MVIQPIGLNELNRINVSLAKSIQTLSTGLKINKPSDNPAGYAAAKIFERDLRATQNQQQNLERQINSESTISTKLESATDTGMRIESLLDQASNSSISAEEKQSIQNEINLLSDQLDDTLQSIDGGGFTAEQFGLNAENLDISSAESLAQAKTSAKSGIDSIIQENQTKGTEIRIADKQKQQLAQNEINLRGSLSTIKDANLIEEMISFTNKSILQQLAVKSIKQGIQSQQQSALSLLG